MSYNLSAPIMSESIADYGAKRVLGMGGSLTGYIQTGNAYDKRYYHKRPCNDTFQKKNSKKRFGKILTAIAAGAAIIGGAFLFLKSKGKIKLPQISALNGKISALFKNNIQKTGKTGDFLEKTFDEAYKHIEKIRNKAASR